MKISMTQGEKVAKLLGQLHDDLGATEEGEDLLNRLVVECVNMGEMNHNKDLAAQLTIARCSASASTVDDNKVWHIYRDYCRRLEKASAEGK